jgi:ParB family transcriptional regulator, chromosome partitioning protein
MFEAKHQKKGLGKGLGALIPQAQPAPDVRKRTYMLVGIEEIRPNPWQPRKKVGSAAIDQLAESIREHGIIQPLVVRSAVNGYELIAGERRWRAAQKAGLHEVPVVIKETDATQQLELALIENIQRQNLNPLEEAEAYQQLLEGFGLSQEEIGQRVGKDRSTIANLLRILKLPLQIREKILEGTLSLGQAKCLLSLDSPQEQMELADLIIKRRLSVRELEKWIKKKGEGVERKSAPLGEREEDWIRPLRRQYQTKIQVKRGKKGGRIEIHFLSEEELIRLVDLLMHP